MRRPWGVGGGSGSGWGVRGGGPCGGRWGSGSGGCERRIEVFVKIQKKRFFFFLGGVGVRAGVGGGRGRVGGSEWM